MAISEQLWQEKRNTNEYNSLLEKRKDKKEMIDKA